MFSVGSKTKFVIEEIKAKTLLFELVTSFPGVQVIHSHVRIYNLPVMV